ncbi:Hypothetical protein, putative [Bodo saltans]|uniref:EF-hand domain-containing protein n=1 Tax=Bodo saltans TaxID=75058 RepID=A0A0S4JED5_BODSA|nr:Hypothetical protein, putative [Bodo saltans]|eukprot:CUG89935.1 Hypothetical protein, putative [Bodo saltans]
MSVRPGVVRKDLHKDEWRAVPSELGNDDATIGSHLRSLYRPASLRNPPTSAGSMRSARVQSARTTASFASTSGSTVLSTRSTIFSPRKTSDPLYNSAQQNHAQCHNDRCCKEADDQSQYRLLPAYQGTFGPPPAYNKDRVVYPPADATTTGKSSSASSPHSPKPSIKAAIAQLQVFEAHLPYVAGSLPHMEQVVQQVVPPPRHNNERGYSSPLTLHRRKSAVVLTAPTVIPSEANPSASMNSTMIAASSPFGTPMMAPVPAPPPTRRPMSGNAAAQLGKPQRHAWIINALREEGALRRESSFIRGVSGPEQVQDQRRRGRERRSSSATGLTIDLQRALTQMSNGAIVPPPTKNAAQQLEVATQIGKIQLASNFVVALVVKFNLSGLVSEYRRFVDKHRPGSSNRLSFIVHHQAGLTLPQFALFLDETVSGEMWTPSGPSISCDDGLVSEDSIRAVFSILADGTTHRLCAADLFATIALSIVPSVAQVNAEYFVNLFDKERTGFVPRTIFHHELIRKYIERHVDEGHAPAWRGLHAIMKKLLGTGHSQFVYLLNEVISAPMTAMARTRLNVDAAPHLDDPEGVFSSHGESRPLGITVREALCVIYAVEDLHDFFLKNSFRDA